MIKPKRNHFAYLKAVGMGCDSLCWCLTWKPSPLGWTLLPDLQHGHLQHVWRRCPGGGLRGGKGVGDVFYVQGAVKKSGSCQKFIARVQTNTFRPKLLSGKLVTACCGSGRYELDHRLRAVWALQSTRSSTCRTRSRMPRACYSPTVGMGQNLRNSGPQVLLLSVNHPVLR